MNPKKVTASLANPAINDLMKPIIFDWQASVNNNILVFQFRVIFL